MAGELNPLKQIRGRPGNFLISAMEQGRDEYAPYLILLKQLLLASGAKVGKERLLQLFEGVQEHCPGFPEQGTGYRDLGQGRS